MTVCAEKSGQRMRRWLAPFAAIALLSCHDAAPEDSGILVVPVEHLAQVALHGESTPLSSRSAAPRTNSISPRLLRRFRPLRDTSESTDDPSSNAKIELGRRLFFDRRLSQRRKTSCNSCHDLANYGVDGDATSTGDRGERGRRNAPSVYHAAAHFAQFWDGRAPTVEEQVKGPILEPLEMAMSSQERVMLRLAAIPEYRSAFAAAFPGDRSPVSFANLGRAIGAFERKLVTPSRWDRYLSGDRRALSAREIEGLRVFTNVGCMVCHTGELLGGTSYQRVGDVEPWPNQNDQGRFEVTGDPADRMMFKVPSLRNVAKTAPYFHDASANTLDEAVRMMGRHQLGLDLLPSEVHTIVAWLQSLTGELPYQYIEAPELPPDPIRAEL